LTRGTTLIIGDEPRVVLPVARSLRRRGIAVLRASLEANAPPLRSRALDWSCSLVRDGTSDAARLASLVDLIRERQVSLVIPTGDGGLRFVAAHEAQLRPLAALSCPAADAVETVLDKPRTLHAAERCGIPVPRSFVLPTLDEALAAGASLRFPLVAKPARKRGAAEFKVRYFGDIAALRAGYAAHPRLGSDCVFQAYVPGVGVGIELLMSDGQPLMAFAHRRIAEYPRTGGVSVLAVEEPLEPALLDASVSLLNQIGWNGVAMVEFRFDRETRSASLLEVNGRFWGSIALPIAAGVDFPFGAWSLAHGLPVEPPRRAPSRARLRWTAGVLLCLHDAARGRDDGLGAASAWSALATALSSLRPGTSDALWSWRDPRPALDELGTTLRTIASDLLKALARRLLPRALVHRVRVYRELGARRGRVYLQRELARAVAPLRLPAAGVRNVLFVCHGNIIRSPMAACSFRRLSTKAVQSAGVRADAGRGADPRAIRIAREFGLDLSPHVSLAVSEDLLRDADLVLVMDARNEAVLLDRHPWARRKIHLLGEFGPTDGLAREIPDPYEGSDDMIRRCYRTIQDCIAGLARAVDAPAQRASGAAS
jgi:protein-tyrosine-phosphatase/predicted ATP-grasp superfamily ATP-dependent carboligase